MSSDDVVVSVQGLTKTYRLYDDPLLRIRQRFEFFGKKYYRDFTALDNISFEIRRGQTIGITGRNGSGKSTLLQMICGIRKPTSGTVQLNGRVSALLELGAGFHPEFTGRENVYMQGAIMGIDRAEMEARLPGIVAFADIGEFLDVPVKTYSSGMFVRLAFAVAVSVEPDILVVDEALSVGDIGFQNKCLERIRELQQAGVTIFLVSHDILLMRNFGDTMIYLENGKIKEMGNPEIVGEAYLRDTLRHAHPAEESDASALPDSGMTTNRIVDTRVSSDGSLIHVRVTALLAHDESAPEIIVQLRDARGYVIYGRHACAADIVRAPATPRGVKAHATLELDARLLVGNYSVTVSLNRLDMHGIATILDKQVGCASILVPSSSTPGFHGGVNLGGKWVRDFPAGRNLLEDAA